MMPDGENARSVMNAPAPTMLKTGSELAWFQSRMLPDTPAEANSTRAAINFVCQRALPQETLSNYNFLFTRISPLKK
jgi:hypothetical protein